MQSLLFANSLGKHTLKLSWEKEQKKKKKMTKSESKTTSRSHTPLDLEQYLNCHPQYFQGQLSVSSQL
jgi:hypothetical protein